jgi:hypothetical protein
VGQDGFSKKFYHRVHREHRERIYAEYQSDRRRYSERHGYRRPCNDRAPLYQILFLRRAAFLANPTCRAVLRYATTEFVQQVAAQIDLLDEVIARINESKHLLEQAIADNPFSNEQQKFDSHRISLENKVMAYRRELARACVMTRLQGAKDALWKHGFQPRWRVRPRSEPPRQRT